jgi:flagellar motor switch protein FliM
VTTLAGDVTGPGAPGPETGRARRKERAEQSLDVATYDFRRPIQLSREHARMLQIGFDGFARQSGTLLTSALRTVCQVTLRSVEQCTYAEYIESLLAPTYMTIYTIDPMPGRGVLELPIQAVMSFIDHILGGPGASDQPVRNLSDIESAVMSGLTARLLGEMRYSLGGVVGFEPGVSGVEYSPQFAQVTGTADVVVVATFDLRVDDHPSRMTVCLPFSSLLPHLVKAAAPTPVSDRERAQRELSADLLHQQFEQVPVEVAVRLRGTRLGPEQLQELAPGDVVSLAHPASAPLDVTVENTVFAHATPGTQGPRLAALIVGTPKES